MEVLLVYLTGCPDASLPSHTHPKPLSFQKKKQTKNPTPNPNHTKQ